MRKRPDLLDGIRIAAPCPATWERMAGDERVRHCTLCDLNVYNFAAMSGDEVRALLARTEGRVCARLYRRADGTLLTSDCPSGVRALRQRLSRWSSATMTALLGVAALLSGCATGKSRPSGSKVKLATERNAASQSAAFAGVVLDETGVPLPGVSVVLRDEAAARETETFTDADGAFHVDSLKEGLYRVEVKLAGFDSALVQHVPLKQSEITRARVSLRLDPGTVLLGAIAVEPPLNPGMTTTFTRDFLDKVPH